MSVPWGITEAALLKLLAGAQIERVTAGHVRVRARLLDGLEHPLDFYFEPPVGGTLRRIGLYRSPRHRKRRGFRDWQARLERVLGPGNPAEETIASRVEGVIPARWQIGRLRVTHEYDYHFGLHERIEFQL